MEWEPETNLAGVLLNCFRSQIKLLREGERVGGGGGWKEEKKRESCNTIKKAYLTYSVNVVQINY